MVDAALGEIITTCSKLSWLISHGERALRPESRASNLILCYKSSKVYYEPLGVVAAIVSWNYRVFRFPQPLEDAHNFLSAAQCLVSHHGFLIRGERDRAQMLRKRVLVHAVVCLGHPEMLASVRARSRACPGMLRLRSTEVKTNLSDTDPQLVCCFPEQADALTKSPRIKHITFIGSETVGRKVRCSGCLLPKFSIFFLDCDGGNRASHTCYP